MRKPVTALQHSNFAEHLMIFDKMKPMICFHRSALKQKVLIDE